MIAKTDHIITIFFKQNIITIDISQITDSTLVDQIGL